MVREECPTGGKSRANMGSKIDTRKCRHFFREVYCKGQQKWGWKLKEEVYKEFFQKIF